MKRMMPVAELARDERFVRTDIVDRLSDPRTPAAQATEGKSGKKRGPAIRQHHAAAARQFFDFDCHGRSRICVTYR